MPLQTSMSPIFNTYVDFNSDFSMHISTINPMIFESIVYSPLSSEAYCLNTLVLKIIFAKIG